MVEPLRQEPRVLPLALSTMFMTMGQGIVVPILPLLVQSFNLTAVMVGWAVSVFALARVIANIPAGVLARQFGVRWVLVLGAGFSGVGNLMIAALPNYTALIAFRFVAGLGSALFITAATIFVAVVSSRANRGRLMAIYQGAFLLGLTLGPAIGGIAADLFGLTSPFIIVAVVSAVSGMWALAKIQGGVAQVVKPAATVGGQTTRRPTQPSSPGFSVFRHMGYQTINLITAGTFLTRSAALFTLWPLLGKGRFGLAPGPLGLFFTLPSAANLLCQPFVGALADRLGRKTLLVPAMFLMAASLLLSAISPVLGLFAVAMVLYGIAQAIEAPTANAYIADVAPASQLPIAMGVNRTVGDVGLVLGAPLVGLIADVAGIPWGLAANAAFMLVVSTAFAFLAREAESVSAVLVAQPGGDETKGGVAT
ncbi:MAG: MFS transporter [Chloroflexi bacterium]|nr:MFS transporter [Chloroflexota bacterium]